MFDNSGLRHNSLNTYFSLAWSSHNEPICAASFALSLHRCEHTRAHLLPIFVVVVFVVVSTPFHSLGLCLCRPNVYTDTQNARYSFISFEPFQESIAYKYTAIYLYLNIWIHIYNTYMYTYFVTASGNVFSTSAAGCFGPNNWLINGIYLNQKAE